MPNDASASLSRALEANLGRCSLFVGKLGLDLVGDAFGQLVAVAVTVNAEVALYLRCVVPSPRESHCVCESDCKWRMCNAPLTALYALVAR